MERFAEAERWLKEAEWDLGTAEDLLRAERFNAASFYSQQAAEKAVKAMLYGLGEIPIGHSVRELLQRFEEVTKRDVGDMLSGGRELDRHYIPSRYPNVHPRGTPHEAYDEKTALRAIGCARTIIDYSTGFVEGLRKKG